MHHKSDEEWLHCFLPSSSRCDQNSLKGLLPHEVDNHSSTKNRIIYKNEINYSRDIAGEGIAHQRRNSEAEWDLQSFSVQFSRGNESSQIVSQQH